MKDEKDEKKRSEKKRKERKEIERTLTSRWIKSFFSDADVVRFRSPQSAHEEIRVAQPVSRFFDTENIASSYIIASSKYCKFIYCKFKILSVKIVQISQVQILSVEISQVEILSVEILSVEILSVETLQVECRRQSETYLVMVPSCISALSTSTKRGPPS